MRIKMKKICVLQNGLTYGGTDTFVLNLINNIDHDRYSITLLLSGDKSNIKRENEVSKYVKIKCTCSLDGFLNKIKHFVKLYKILKKEKYDAFQSNIDLFNGLNMFVAWLAGVPIRECHSHNSQHDKELTCGRSVAVRIYQKVMRWMCWNFSNRRCGCSAIAMDFLFENKWRNDKNSRIVHNGIDFSQYCKSLNTMKKKEELGLKKHYNICTVGRISYQKNPLFIVDVMDELFKIRDDCDFVWVGTGEMKNEVNKKINKYGISDRIHFLENRNDVSEILRSMEIFFLPSYFEGLAIVLIEAQAAGLPCVTSTTTTQESNCGSLLYVSFG